MPKTVLRESTTAAAKFAKIEIFDKENARGIPREFFVMQK